MSTVSHRLLGLPAGAWAGVVLAFGVGLTLLAALPQHRALVRAEKLELQNMADQSFVAVNDELNKSIELVDEVRHGVTHNPNITQEQFLVLYANLKPLAPFSSLQAIAFSKGEMNKDGTTHYITNRVAPVVGNEKLMGLDVASQPANFRAMEEARDKNSTVMTTAFRLIQQPPTDLQNDGVVIRVPVYDTPVAPEDVEGRRRHFMGSLVVSFRVSALINRALSTKAKHNMDVKLWDVTNKSHTLMFNSLSDQKPALGAPEDLYHSFSRDFSAGGRKWRMEMSGANTAAGSVWLPTVTLGLGLVVSFILAMLAGVVASTRARALFMAQHMSHQYKESEEKFRALNELLPALVVLAQPDGTIVYANKVARERLWQGQDGAGYSVVDFFEDKTFCQAIQQTLADGKTVSHQAVEVHPSYEPTFWGSVSISSVVLGDKNHILAVVNDVTNLHALTSQLDHQAHHDSLTGLGNRRDFEQKLAKIIGDVSEKNNSSAFLYFDLDQFKIINDTSGHAAGDQLLVELSTLLQTYITPNVLVFRLGGDEFGILIEHIDAAVVWTFAEKIRKDIDSIHFSWDNRLYAVSVSVGVVMIDRADMSARDIMSYADTACYMAKERGRNRVHLYSEKDRDTEKRRTEMQWASRLRQALVEERFMLYYQEIVPLQENLVGGPHIEVLVRLFEQDGSMVSPAEFIPAAERFGLMLELDRWVVKTVFSKFKNLHHSGMYPRMCAINLSAQTVEDETFVPYVLAQLGAHKIDPSRICFEITETAALANRDRAIGLMNTLRTWGIHFSLDDFGSGMASFSYLRDLPVDYVKIDGAFVKSLSTDGISASIVRAVTDIGHQLQIEVIAEWVEDQESLDRLKDMGVDEGQGFFLHRPAPALYTRPVVNHEAVNHEAVNDVDPAPEQNENPEQKDGK